jgi:hypothetical protein
MRAATSGVKGFGILGDCQFFGSFDLTFQYVIIRFGI